MNILKEIFVTYEIATKLKEVGFDEKCIAHFNSTSIEPDCPYLYIYSDYNKNSTEVDYCFTIPTWEQVLTWFRDRKIYGYVLPCFNESFKYHIYYIVDYSKSDEGNCRDAKVYRTDKEDWYKEYSEAREALILKLIEIYKHE